MSSKKENNAIGKRVVRHKEKSKNALDNDEVSRDTMLGKASRRGWGKGIAK